MASNFFKKLSDLTHIHNRAAFTDVPKRAGMTESAFKTLVKERFSCRAFKSTPLTQAQIDNILEAARLAPTAANKQPVHVWVVKSEEGLAKLKKATDYTYGAPVVFMVGAKPNAAWVRKYDGKNGAEIDAAIVGTHIMLEASALGLGNVWVGSFDPAQIKADFPETEGYEVVCLFPVGVSDAEPGSMHFKRQSAAEFSDEI
ncbi:MAG: nitroreductase family protein [Bacteroidales bacterium]|nr:nitroreductase family protein [Bacteroidales bacterium]MBR6876083.1 nitroreductase family protein [Bacteroidales bacterium]